MEFFSLELQLFLVNEVNKDGDDELSGVSEPDEENVDSELAAGVVDVDALLVAFKAFELVMQVTWSVWNLEEISITQIN